MESIVKFDKLARAHHSSAVVWNVTRMKGSSSGDAVGIAVSADAVGSKLSRGDRVNDEIYTPVGVEVSTGGCVVNKVGAPDGVEVSTGDYVVKKEGAPDVMVFGWSPGASVCPSVVGVCVVRD